MHFVCNNATTTKLLSSSSFLWKNFRSKTFSLLFAIASTYILSNTILIIAKREETARKERFLKKINFVLLLLLSKDLWILLFFIRWYLFSFDVNFSPHKILLCSIDEKRKFLSICSSRHQKKIAYSKNLSSHNSRCQNNTKEIHLKRSFSQEKEINWAFYHPP